MSTPAKQLLGMTLEGGWEVIQEVVPTKGATGGNFSAGYVVRDKDGNKGFLKALDFSAALQSQDPAAALKALTEAYVYERDVLLKCRDCRMSKIVRAMSHGSVKVPGGGIGSVVQYLIFELAEGDVRTELDSGGTFDVAWVLRSLHHVATGLRQLHGQFIAHQVLKPSNVVVFNNRTSKIADLGRAASKGTVAPHDQKEIAGDRTYAPPELLYGYVDPDWNSRRLGCDIYLLGSMIVFFFTGMSMSGLLASELTDAHRWGVWTGTYDEVMPYLRDAFGRAILHFRNEVVVDLRDDLENAVRELCDPDPQLRGDSKNVGTVNQFSLERFVSRFDLLASKAEYGIIGR